MATEFGLALAHAYQGEVAGQAFFETLAETASDDLARHKWRVLARLETAMQRRLRPAIVAMGLDATPDPNRIEQGEDAARRYEGLPWPTQMQSMKPILIRAIADFEALEHQARDEHREICAALTAHEQALLTFAERELAGEPNSLSTVQALLGTAE